MASCKKAREPDRSLLGVNEDRKRSADAADGHRSIFGTQIGLSSPTRVLCDERGRIWVSDAGHRRIVALEPNGIVHAIIGAARLHMPQGMALAGGRLLVADPLARAVVVVDLSGRTPPARLEIDGEPVDVAVDVEAGALYIADAA